MYYFIVNPTSSSGRGVRVWAKCAAILEERGIEYKLYELEKPGDAGRIAAEIAGLTPCTAVVVGGDGTLNEFLTGLPSFEGITFACIPTGSGNDFARGMRLPSNPEDLMDMILNPTKFRSINVGITSSGDRSRAFAVSSGIGFDAAVCHAVDVSSFKKVLNAVHLGKLIYLFNALRMLFSMKFFSIRLLTDDHQLLTYEKVCFAAAMNTRYEGGGFCFAPKASPVDDQIDLIYAEGIPKWKLLCILPTALFGKHTGFRGIHIVRCRRAVIQADSDQCIHTDGEHFGCAAKVTFSLRPEHLRMIVD